VGFITQQGKLEAVLLNELTLTERRVSTNTDDLDSSLLEFVEFITESLAFCSSAGGPGFREEPQD